MKKNDRVSFVNRLKYEFDKTISRGPLALGAWVALVSAIILLVLSLGLHFSGLDPNMGLKEILWTMLMQALAPNPVPFSGPATFLAAMLLITLLGLFMVSIFIGIIATAIDAKVQSLREGRSQVIEKDHTVILGWDEHIFSIISQLAQTNLHQRRSCIVILAEQEKVKMEEEIKARMKPASHLEIVCRSGSPIDMVDLEIVSINTARSIIILAPDGEDPDTYIIKALLAIMNNPDRRLQPYHIVTEIHEASNLDVARLVGKDETTILLISDIIAHIVAQTCRQSSLSVVYIELMNFEGDEIYFKKEPTLAGRTFGEALLLYEDSAVIGLCPEGGKPKLNPPMETPLGANDQLIVIAEEQETIRLSGKTLSAVDEQGIRVRMPAPAAPEATLILGWNERGSTILRELDNYVSSGSKVKVVADVTRPEAEMLAQLPLLKNQVVSFQAGHTSDRGVLTALCKESFDHVIVLADQEAASIQLADARTLITLLNLREINRLSGTKQFSIVSEMLDVRNRNLATVTHVDDFIVSDELASLLMAQISENKELNLVFEDLFYPEGSEIYLKPAADYVNLGQPVNFYTVVEAARRRCEVAIGYRVVEYAGDPQKGYGIVINPDKSKAVQFREGDKVIVLAEG